MNCEGTGNALKSTPTLDHLVLYLGFQLSHIQVLNVAKNLQLRDLENLQVEQRLTVPRYKALAI